jgi:chain length determinant protein (polysaccharide antigen chain regulator)
LAPYSIEDVYRVFLRNLQSETLRREFFVNEYLPKLHDIQKSQPQDVLYSKFSKRIVVSPLSADLTGRYSVAVQTSSAEEAVSWVNNYVKRAESLAQDEIVKNVSYEAKVRARNLEHEINNERETGEKARGDSITKLREALIVAQAAGLQRPAMMLGNSPNGVVGSMEGDLVFMRGVEALSAEIKNLENRSSDDAFINHLRDLQGKQNFYKQLAAMPLELKMYRYDGSVELPDYAIKPKKALVILLALVLGVMLGVLFAFILHCFNDGRVGENIKSSNKA